MYNNIFYRKYVDFLSTLENEDFFEFLAFQLKQTDDIVELRQFLKKYRQELVVEFNRVNNPTFGVTDKRLEQRLIFLQQKLKEPNPSARFQVGLAFAQGHIQGLKEQYQKGLIVWSDAPKIVGLPNNTRQYISDTLMNNKGKGNRNFLESPKTIREVYDYCIKNDITMVNEFLILYKSIETDR